MSSDDMKARATKWLTDYVTLTGADTFVGCLAEFARSEVDAAVQAAVEAEREACIDALQKEADFNASRGAPNEYYRSKYSDYGCAFQSAADLLRARAATKPTQAIFRPVCMCGEYVDQHHANTEPYHAPVEEPPEPKPTNEGEK